MIHRLYSQQSWQAAAVREFGARGQEKDANQLSIEKVFVYFVF
jgi:hypothetical protein